MNDSAGTGADATGRHQAGMRDATCPRCGARFGCGVNAATCWCVNLEALSDPAPAKDGAAASCYCERCLRELLAAQR